jgi:hypothetical protein
LIAIAGLAGLTLFALANRHLPDAASREDAKREWRTPNALPHGRRAHRGATRQSPPTTQRSTLMTRYVSPRFVSWLAIGIAAAFLVVATTTYSPSTIMWLAFAISIGTLVVSTSISLTNSRSVATLVTGSVTALVSAWTIVASLVFSLATVQNLALGGALAIAGLAIVGATAHEVSVERAAVRAGSDIPERESRLAAAA